jgi:hypothetical protein
MDSQLCKIVIKRQVYKPFEPYVEDMVLYGLKNCKDEILEIPRGYIQTKYVYENEVWVLDDDIQFPDDGILDEEHLTKKFLVIMSVERIPWAHY